MSTPYDAAFEAAVDELESINRQDGALAAAAACRARLADAAYTALPRAMLFVLQGDFLSMGGREDEAVLAYREAVDDGGPTVVDARAALAWALFDTGRAEEGEAALTELRRSKSINPQTYSYVAELYETHADLGSALRWFTAGLTRALRADGIGMNEVGTAQDDVLSETTYVLLSGRRRVRQAQGFPDDELDAIASERAQEVAGDAGNAAAAGELRRLRAGRQGRRRRP